MAKMETLQQQIDTTHRAVLSKLETIQSQISNVETQHGKAL